MGWKKPPEYRESPGWREAQARKFDEREAALDRDFVCRSGEPPRSNLYPAHRMKHDSLADRRLDLRTDRWLTRNDPNKGIGKTRS